MRIPSRVAIATALAAAAPAAHAARPFNTDDARIVDPGGYQIESFVKVQRGTKATEYWFLPAHNFGGALDRLEFTLGGNVVRSSDDGNSNLIVGQVKTLLKPLEANGIGFAFTLGVNRFKPGAGGAVDTGPLDLAITGADDPKSTKLRYNPFFNGISSVSVLDDAAVFHFNGGAARDTVGNQTSGTWGVGAEIRINDRVFGIAEGYGQSDAKPAYQAGIRFWAIPGSWQVDGTVGMQNADPQRLRWISIGVRILW